MAPEPEPLPSCPGCGQPLNPQHLICPVCLVSRLSSAPLPPENGYANCVQFQWVGRGGMGQVYKARHQTIGRWVAIKVLRPWDSPSDPEMKSFLKEAKFLGGLNHPNIVQIYEADQKDDDYPYIVMEYVERTLQSEIGRGPLHPDLAARYMRAVAAAIAYVHEQRIIHRDIKPSNILIDDKDEPRVADFGLARRFDTQGELSWSKEVAGTPPYMAPEQLQTPSTVDELTDVYGIGATLYQCITAELPRPHIPMGDPIAPRELNPQIPVHLEEICLRCLSRDRTERYQSAQEVADDLQDYLKRAPLAARHRARRLARWCRRNPMVVWPALAFVVLLVGTWAVPVKLSRDNLRTNVAHVEHTASAIRADLQELERLVEVEARRPELARALAGGHSGAIQQLLQRVYTSHENTTYQFGLSLRTWLLLDLEGKAIINYPPKEDPGTDRSFRDYFRGPRERAARDLPDAPHYSLVYRSLDDQSYKFGVSYVVRDHQNTLLGILVAMAGTNSTERAWKFAGDESKTVLVARTESPPPDKGPPLPTFLIMLHPAFGPSEDAIAIDHPNLHRLLAREPTSPSELGYGDPSFVDPVGERHPEYRKPWLCAFARVPGTPFVTMLQTPDPRGETWRWLAVECTLATTFGIGLGLRYRRTRAARR